MKNHLACLAVAFAFGVSACAHLSQTTPKPTSPPTYTVCRTIDVDTAFEEEAACPEWRKIAVASDAEADCPVPAAINAHAWTVNRLFTASPPSSLPPALSPFCLYETGTNNAEILTGLNANLQSLIDQGRLERVDSSCAAVSTTAGLISSSWQRYKDNFLVQAGQVDLAGLLPESVDPTVRLTIVDTQPNDQLTQQGKSNHGFTLAHLARRLICTDEPGNSKCVARVTSRLALPIVDFDRSDSLKTTIDDEEGGYYGSVDQLADAVWQEINSLDHTVAGQRLVLNLSVAWDGARFGGLEARVEDMPAPMQALYRALEVASCRGALTVAAAGNRLGGFDEAPGPLLPGGWERRNAPSAETCSSIDPSRESHAASYRAPLVYAVGGVRASGSPLANARLGGEPPLVAYGDHAVVESPNSKKPTGILTGSSVATAVVSAAAATVWRLRPDLTRVELMELLYQSGEDLERIADFHHRAPQTAPSVRRIALCPAVGHACSGGACLNGPPECLETPRLASSSTTASWKCQPANLADATAIKKSLGDVSLCPARDIYFDPSKGPPTDPCPIRQFFGVEARPWNHPQPGSNPCSACGDEEPGNDGDGLRAPQGSDPTTLRIEVDSEWKGGTLEEGILDIGDTSFALGLDPLQKNGCAIVTGIDPKLLQPSEDGLEPPVILRFRVVPKTKDEPVASVEIPVFIGGEHRSLSRNPGFPVQ